MTGFAFPLIAIVAGCLAAAAVVIQKLPDAEKAIEKIKPYEAFIGVAALLFGIMQLLSIGKMFGSITGLVALAATVSCILMGFLLGFPVLQDMVINDMSEDSRAKAAEWYQKLTPYKITAGLTAIGTGIYLLIF